MALSDEHHATEPGLVPRRNTFPRVVRLKRRRLIRPLFDRRRQDVGTVATGCVRVLYRIVPRRLVGANVPVQVGCASGRTQTAVQRNRIRRLLREVYRVHQHDLVDLFSQRSDTLTLMLLFRGRPEVADQCIPQDVPRALGRLVEHLHAVDQ